MRHLFGLGFMCLAIAGLCSAQSSKSGMTIDQSTKFCESAVPDNCIQRTCPQYCNSFRTRMSRTRCTGECTKEGRCKLKPAAGQDDPKNQALDAQNRDQLWACIAEKRDPNGTTSGRRVTPWQQLMSPSFAKAVKP